MRDMQRVELAADLNAREKATLGHTHGAAVRRVVVVDDADEIRMRLAALVQGHPELEVVGQSGSVIEALHLIDTLAHDALVLDLQLSDGSGLDLLQALRSRPTRPQIIVLTNYPLPKYRARCLQLGADHFLDKTFEFEQVANLLRGADCPVPKHNTREPRGRQPHARMTQLLGRLSYQTMDVPQDALCADIAALAAQICATPRACIQMLDSDRHWYFGASGWSAQERAAARTFATAVAAHQGMHSHLSTTPDLRFYGGVPVPASAKHVRAVLCVVDDVVRTLSADAVAALQALGRQLDSLLEFRQLALDLQRVDEQRSRAERRLVNAALRDPLTGLSNRRAFDFGFERALLTGQRLGRPLACLSLDLDSFKTVNDCYGHASGDRLLREVAQRLREPLRKSDLIARMGGDEFALILSNVASPEHVLAVAHSLIERLSAPFDFGCLRIEIGGCIGISRCPVDGHDAATLMGQADIALYRAKAAGRNQARFFDCAMLAIALDPLADGSP